MVKHLLTFRFSLFKKSYLRNTFIQQFVLIYPCIGNFPATPDLTSPLLQLKLLWFLSPPFHAVTLFWNILTFPLFSPSTLSLSCPLYKLYGTPSLPNLLCNFRSFPYNVHLNPWIPLYSSPLACLQIFI